MTKTMTIIACILLFTNSVNCAELDEIVLEAGRSTVLPFKSSNPLHVDKYGVVKITNQTERIKIRGLKTGRVTIHSAGATQQVLVLSSRRYQVYKELQSALEHSKGIEIDYFNGAFQLMGQLLRAKDFVNLMPRLQDLPFDVHVHLDVTSDVGENLKILLLEKIPVDLRHHKIKFDFQSTWTAFLPGNHNSKELSKNLKSWGFRVKEQNQWHRPKPLVEISVGLMEVSQNWLNEVGFNWNLQSHLQLSPGPMKEVGSSAIKSVLEGAESEGSVLAQPKIVTQSGRKGSFFSGGEFATRIVNEYQQSVSWKNYGLLLEVTPTTHDNDVTEVNLALSLSAPQPGNGVDGIPSLTRKRLNTFITIENNKRYILTDLTQNLNGLQLNKIPGFSAIPLVGHLFQKNNTQENKSWLIITIKSRVVGGKP